MNDQLLSDAKWIPIFNKRIEDRANPLAPVQFKQEFYKHLIRIQITADKIPKNWKYAGYLIHRLDNFTTNPFIAENISVQVNVRQLVNLQNLTSRFYLEFQPLSRFLWMDVKIEFFDGQI
ncbi:MAG: hypothetical protein VKK42_02505 [Lyngbya sp.]|nr:hypothetical protein [Lyngbya sp.]